MPQTTKKPKKLANRKSYEAKLWAINPVKSNQSNDKTIWVWTYPQITSTEA